MLDTANVAAYESMSPSLLAQQPPSLPYREEKVNSDWETIFTYLESRMGMLRALRYSWWAFWSVLARYFVPRRYIWLVVANRMWRGSNLNDSIVDSTGQLAVRTCAAGMWTGLCSPSRPWFKLGVEQPYEHLIDSDGKAWLEEEEAGCYATLSGSNFYTSMAQVFQDETVFGTAPLICYEDDEDVCRFYTPCAGEYYLANSARFAVTDFYREFTLTVKQIVDMFTLRRCPQQIVKLWTQGAASLDVEFVVCHCIEPNFDLDSKTGGKVQVVPKRFVWREVYWLKGVKTAEPLSKRGFYEARPHAVFRWALTSNDPYGRCPAMDGIGDTKQIQLQTYRGNEYLEKGVRPPMGASPELKNEPSSVMAGMITYTSTKEGFWPLFQVAPAWYSAIMEAIKTVAARVDRCFFVDLFLAISRMEGVQPRNELELTKRDLERLQELGPVIDLNEAELSVVLRRVMDIRARRGLSRPVPPSLARIFAASGGKPKIKYVSILRLAQRAAESIAMKDAFATFGQLSSAAKAAGVPDPIRVVNLDKSVRKYAELNNYPIDCLFTDGEVKQHDAIRQQEMQKAQAPGQAMAAVTAAKTLSDTQMPGTPGGSALGALLGHPSPSAVPGGGPLP